MHCYEVYVATYKYTTAHHKIYLTGYSPDKDAESQVHDFDINRNQWGQLPLHQAITMAFLTSLVEG